jgi:replicative DNA helicase
MLQKNTAFDFNRDFQIEILNIIFNDFNFLILCNDLIDPDYFSDNVLIWYFKCMRDYYLDYDLKINETALDNEIIKAIKSNKLKDKDADAIIEVRKKLNQKIIDKEYVTDEVVNFCKHQAIAKATLAAPELLEKGDFETIQENFNEAFLIDKSRLDIGHWFFKDYKERVRERGEERELSILPVGIPDLDNLIGGGLNQTQYGIWMAPTNRGKCWRIGTEVLRYNGSLVKVEDVKVGDLLMGPDSKPRTVLGTTRGSGSLYEINPHRAEPWVCNEDHILTLVTTDTDKIIDIPLTDYLKSSKTFKHRHKQFSTGVEFPPLTKPLPIDPYFLGVWFGDGKKSTNVKGKRLIPGVAVTKPDIEIENAVKDIAAKYNLSFRKARDKKSECFTYHITTGEAAPPKGQYGGTPNKFLDLLRKVVGQDCSIPPEYLIASVKERREFLAGFLDTDGGLDGCKFDFSQKRQDYSEAVCFIARSLGLRASLTPKSVPGHGIHWRVTITGELDQLPLRIERKKPGPRKRKTDVRRTGFKVSPIGDGEYAGFELDGDGRCLLSDFTVTHNSIALAHCGKQAILRGKKVVYYSLEMSERDQSDRYDAAMCHLAMQNLAEFSDEILQKMKKFNKIYEDSLLIKTFTEDTTILTIRAHLQRLFSIGWFPDLILIDYLELITPSRFYKERREETSLISRQLSKLSLSLKIPIWTATQSNRAAIALETHTDEHVAEDYGKLRPADIGITLNQTQDEAQDSIMRLFIMKNRNGPRYRSVKIQNDFEKMCFYRAR